METHNAPGMKTCCITYCGCCPCRYCSDDFELSEAQEELETLKNDIATDREGIVQIYVTKKHISTAEAEKKVDEKLAAAEAKVAKLEEELWSKQRTRMSSSMSACQTAVSLPCMVGM